jgi:uncharacterized protein (UPF0264 family)
VASIAAIVEALRRQRVSLPISATIGDLPMHALSEIQARVDAVGACGVDYVKVGITRDAGAGGVLDGLAHCGAAVVPVFIADRGLDEMLIARAAALGFPALMVDTADKRAGSLFDAVPVAALRRFIAAARSAGALVGVAGALQRSHALALADLAPDFAGFRSAVCLGGRSHALDAPSLRDLVEAMRQVAPA